MLCTEEAGRGAAGSVLVILQPAYPHLSPVLQALQNINLALGLGEYTGIPSGPGGTANIASSRTPSPLL